MNTISQNASRELDDRAHQHMKSHSVDYRTALYAVAKADRGLSRRYSHGIATMSKAYADTLTAAQRAMVELVADPEKTRRLAGDLIDTLARRKLINVGGGSPANPADAYRRAVSDINKEFPTLSRTAQDGFIADTDFELLGMLIPSVAGEVEKGNYSDSTRCQCGQNKALCRGRKYARQHHVPEDDDVAFARCIRNAQMYGDELDKIYCYYR